MSQEPKRALASIRTNINRLRGKEAVIAAYILENPRNIIHMTISQLSEELGVADSTVFRFCQKTGFSGFQSFKIALASEVITPLEDIHEKIHADDSVSAITEKVIRSNMKSLEDTLAVHDEKEMERAVKFVVEARTIGFFGNGGSAIVALDGYHKFLRAGLSAFSNMDSHLQIMSAARLGREDLAIVVSHTGSTKDTLDVIRVIKERQVPIIGITNQAISPLSKAADVKLFTVSEETDFRSEALASRIAQLSLMDALYTNVMMARGDAGREALEQMRKAIALKRI
ncbi:MULTISPECIES: MurR/RpiR family transcriptional regulator [Bhargavaea]|uniref:MurR/RpiR family transcriptional regulator n=1 Tax=Bhargavaea changchunensis TaxID=2134037 RepID=A0ABW2NLS3_9BACL|nr:MurR/RpiR family transcriptional regulator [Bhargavaea sp. CC-171006]